MKIKKKHLEMDADYSQLIEQWKMFKGNISLCGSKFICQNSETRKNIETLEDKFSELLVKLQSYIKLYKSFKKKYDNKVKKEEFDIHSFLNSKDLEWQLRDARENLKEISDLCKEISKIYEKLERSYVKNAKRFSI